MAGAQFSVTNSEGIVVETITSNELGVAETTNPLPFGKYILKETKAPEGFVLDDTPLEVRLSRGEETEQITLHFMNEALPSLPPEPGVPGKGSIHIIKQDSETFAPLSGAEFSVTNEDGSDTTRIVTDETGHGQTTKPLEFGDYVVVETKAPEGYEIDETPIHVTIVEGKDSNVVTFKVLNTDKEKGGIHLVKQDKEDYTKLLAGAEFDVQNTLGETVDHIVTDKTGHGETTKGLELGEYTLIETKAPEGYELDDRPIIVVVKDDNDANVVTIKVKNTPLPSLPPEPGMPGKGSIHIIKRDEAHYQKLLAGAEFNVYTADGETLIDTIVTDKTGHGQTTKPLDFGKYTVIEMKAP